jgi:uncharacterized protein (TIRG00374 family)
MDGRWRIVRMLMVAMGVTLFAILVWRNDPAALLHSIRQLSWRLLIVVAFPFPLVNALDTLGWRFAFRRDRVPFRALFLARLAGEAFNLTTPTASVGGEPVKAWLVRQHIAFDESFPSVIIAKTTVTIGQGHLLNVGQVCAWPQLPHHTPLLSAMVWLLIAEIVAVAGFVAVQIAGLLGNGGRALGRFRFLARLAGSLGRLDDSLATYYRREPVRLTLSVTFHFLGWLAGALEVWVILHLLGVEIGFGTAILIEAFSTALRFATFMLPAGIGVLEGGHVAMFSALGLGAATGLSFSLVRRIREATWIGIGLLLLATIRNLAPTPAAARPG